MDLDNSINLELFEKGPTVLFVWKNSPGWPVESVSANLHTVFSYTPDQYLSGDLDYADQIHPDDLERVTDEVQEASSDLSCDSIEHQPYRYLDGNGKYRWVKDSTRIIRSEHGNITHYIGYLIDISTETELKSQIVENEKRWRTAVDGIGDGLWDWNIPTNKVYFSDRWKKMLGFKSDEISSTLDEWAKRVHLEDLEQVYTDIQKCMKGETSTYRNKHRVLCKDGAYKWILDRGIIIEWNDQDEPIRMIGTHTDIDESEQYHQNLILMQRRYEALMKYASDALFIMDFDGNLHECNHMAANMLGYTMEEMTSLSVYDWDVMIPQNELPALMRGISSSEPICFETKHRRKDGSIYDASITAIKIIVDGTELLYASARDITQLKENEAILLELNYKLNNLAQNVPGVVYSYQYFPDGRSCFPYASEHIYDIYGVIPSEVQHDAGKVFAVLHPDDAPFITNSIKNSFEQLTLWEMEYRVLHPKKGEIWVKGIAKPTAQNDGSVLWYGYIFDITDQKRAELIIQSHVAYLKTNTKGVITEISPNFCKLIQYDTFGYETCVRDFIGKNINILKSGYTHKNVYQTLWNTIEKGEIYTHDIENRNFNDGTNWYRVTITPDTNEQGKIQGYIAFYNNIDDQIQLEHDANTDFLTGIYNRFKFEQLFSAEIHRCKRYNIDLSIILVDIDHFKDVNDTFGHAVGDIFLKEFAEIISRHIRKNDIFARWGGEEFIILCPHTNSIGARVLAETLRKTIESFSFTKVQHKTASFGVAQFDSHMDAKTFFTHVDSALYEAKEAGRNQVISF